MDQPLGWSTQRMPSLGPPSLSSKAPTSRMWWLFMLRVPLSDSEPKVMEPSTVMLPLTAMLPRTRPVPLTSSRASGVSKPTPTLPFCSTRRWLERNSPRSPQPIWKCSSSLLPIAQALAPMVSFWKASWASPVAEPVSLEALMTTLASTFVPPGPTCCSSATSWFTEELSARWSTWKRRWGTVAPMPTWPVSPRKNTPRRLVPAWKAARESATRAMLTSWFQPPICTQPPRLG